jgi:hypothetical protein
MPLYLTILEGATPDEARPILAIRDAQILAMVREMLTARLSEGANPRSRVHAVSGRVPHAIQQEGTDAVQDKKACQEPSYVGQE